jgi:hypothetical protein
LSPQPFRLLTSCNNQLSSCVHLPACLQMCLASSVDQNPARLQRLGYSMQQQEAQLRQQGGLGVSKVKVKVNSLSKRSALNRRSTLPKLMGQQRGRVSSLFMQCPSTRCVLEWEADMCS